jgi:hypothetical protein
MSTRGYIIIKYKGLYYRIYNHFDSYPSYLGKAVVSFLTQHDPSDPLSFLASVINFFLLFKDHNPPPKLGDGLIRSSRELSIHSSFPTPNFDIEWSYIIDLDSLIFSIDGGFYKPAYNFSFNDDGESLIPLDWFSDFTLKNDSLASLHNSS